MIANSQMTCDRFLRRQSAKRLCKRIRDHLASGGLVRVATYTRAVIYDKRHADSFMYDKHSVYVRRGKSWDCIDYCGIHFGR